MAAKPEAEFGRVGFVSTRIAGTDGVSLEVGKWAEILDRIGVQCYYIAGTCDRPSERTFIIEEAHFEYPSVKEIHRRAFGGERRDPLLTYDILDIAQTLRQKLRTSIEQLGLDLLIVENALAIPLNIPLGIAIVQVIQEMDIPCIGHHHDFYWERDRFVVSTVDDFIRAAFPPALPQIEHVVINSVAAGEFSRRTGLPCRIIPNVMDFYTPPPPSDDYALRFRDEIGLDENDLLILQPTRVVPRKGIEHSVELIRRLEDPRARLVITHGAGDEGDAYFNWLRGYAKLLDVEILFASPWISHERRTTADGKSQFAIWDVYPQADLVTYPSTYEGFGNAFLEAVYYRCPILCNRYAIYRSDIEPSGFRVVLMDGFLANETIDEVRRVLDDQEYRREMVEHNCEVARRHFSYDYVEHELRSIFYRLRNAYGHRA